MPMPTVLKVMTPFPFSVDVSDKLADAEKMMIEQGFHHLPVKDGNELVGVLSERDAAIARSVRAEGASGEPVSVRSACRGRLLVVGVKEGLDEVMFKMAERRVTAALVTREGKLAGILTTTDVYRLLGGMLRDKYPSDDGDDVA